MATGVDRVVQITNKQEYDQFKQNNRRCVVFYSATWCSACTEMKDIYHRIANRYHERVAMAYVDIDQCGLEFSSVPVFVSLFEGQQFNGVEGASREELKQLIKEIIQTSGTRPGELEVEPVPNSPPRRKSTHRRSRGSGHHSRAHPSSRKRSSGKSGSTKDEIITTIHSPK